MLSKRRGATTAIFSITVCRCTLRVPTDESDLSAPVQIFSQSPFRSMSSSPTTSVRHLKNQVCVGRSFDLLSNTASWSSIGVPGTRRTTNRLNCLNQVSQKITSFGGLIRRVRPRPCRPCGSYAQVKIQPPTYAIGPRLTLSRFPREQRTGLRGTMATMFQFERRAKSQDRKGRKKDQAAHTDQYEGAYLHFIQSGLAKTGGPHSCQARFSDQRRTP